MIPSKKGKRFANHVKVTPEPSPRTLNHANSGAILSAVGFHSPSPVQSRQNSAVIHASNSYNALPNLQPLPSITPMYSSSIQKSDSNVSSSSGNGRGNQELLLDLFDSVPTRGNNNRRGSKDYPNNNSPDKGTCCLALFICVSSLHCMICDRHQLQALHFTIYHAITHPAQTPCRCSPPPPPSPLTCSARRAPPA